MNNSIISFTSDYTEGAHGEIIKRFAETSLEQNIAYGYDKYSESASEKIRKACNCPEAQIAFLTGGTQTNMIAIDSLLKPYEGVIAAVSGHVNLHEASAIEYSGHKVMTLPQHDGKISACELKKLLEDFWKNPSYTHMTFPGMTYISHPTEYGTLYTKAELEDISTVCREYNIPLYIDGARMGYGVMSDGTDVDLQTIADCADVFYIGGTKIGALCGEALVFTKNNMPQYFLTIVKQHGALLAKSWLTSLQFDVLFTDGLYFKIARHAIEMANSLRKVFRDKGYEFFVETVTNQIFVILDNIKAEELQKEVMFELWETIDEKRSVYRFVTSWATPEENINRLATLL